LLWALLTLADFLIIVDKRGGPMTRQLKDFKDSKKIKNFWTLAIFLTLAGCGEDLTVKDIQVRRAELAKSCTQSSDCVMMQNFIGCKRPAGFAILRENQKAYEDLKRIYEDTNLSDDIVCTADSRPEDDIRNLRADCSDDTQTCIVDQITTVANGLIAE